MTDLIGGQVPLTFDTNVAALPMLQAGKVKALAVTSAKRSPSLPKVPTVAEAGYPDFEMVPWITIVAPRGLPAAGAADARARRSPTRWPTPRCAPSSRRPASSVGYQPGSLYDARVAKELPLLRAYVHKAEDPGWSERPWRHDPTLPERSAVELRRLIGSRQLSPVELMDACIARIEALNPAVNAIAATDFERARDARARGRGRT